MRKFTAVPGKGIFAASRRRIVAAEEYDGKMFDWRQMDQIHRGLEAGLDVSQYADPKFDYNQMEAIRYGLEHGFDVTPYAELGYSGGQMLQIAFGLARGLDIDWYADLKFDEQQMDMIYWGLVYDLDVSTYADPKYNYDQMSWIYYGLQDGLDVSVYADPKFDDGQMWEIYEGLRNGLDVSIYANPEFTKEQMDVLRKGLNNGIDVTPYADPNISAGDMEAAIFPDKRSASSKSSKSWRWSSLKRQLKDEAQDTDPLHNITDAGDYLESIMRKVQDELGVWLEASTQGGVGKMYFMSSDGSTPIADPVDYGEFNEHAVDLALSSKSKSDFMNKYNSYLKSILNQ